MVSLPRPPWTLSWPLPALMVSLPSPPLTTSSPSPANTMSSPAPALMVSWPPSPTIQSAAAVPVSTSLLCVPMMTLRPEALQKATGSSGADKASPLLDTCALPVAAPQPASPIANATVPTIQPTTNWVFIFPALLLRELHPRCLVGCRATQPAFRQAPWNPPMDASPRTIRDRATGSPRNRDRQSDSRRDIESSRECRMSFAVVMANPRCARAIYSVRALLAGRPFTRGDSGPRSDRAFVRLVHAADGWGVSTAEQTRISDSSECSASDRRKPEQPELTERPATDEHCRPGAARGIDGQVGNRNANQVDQGQRETDWDGREAGRRTTVGRAEDDEQEEEGEHQFRNQRGDERVVAGRVFAVAIGREARAEAEAVGAAGNHIFFFNDTATTEDLGGDIPGQLLRGKSLGGAQSDGDRRIEVATGNMADRISHGQDGQPECQ